MFGNRAEQDIDRCHPPGQAHRASHHAEFVLEHLDLGARLDDIDRIGLDRQVIGDRNHLHRRMARQQFTEHAFEIARQMHDHDESAARIGGGAVKKPLQRLEPARRCAEPDHKGREPLLSGGRL